MLQKSKYYQFKIGDNQYYFDISLLDLSNNYYTIEKQFVRFVNKSSDFLFYYYNPSQQQQILDHINLIINRYKKFYI